MHDINLYYPKKGGHLKLFRKIGNQSGKYI